MLYSPKQWFQRLRIMLIVPTFTLNCQQIFPLMKLNKSDLRVWMIDEHMTEVCACGVCDQSYLSPYVSLLTMITLQLLLLLPP